MGMLVLTRKLGEAIIIDSNIAVTVLEKASGGVKIGFNAPEEVPIYREEMFARNAVKDFPRKRKSFGDGMLILTRRIDDVVRIGNDIKVRVLSITHKPYIDNYEIKLGITAPKSISVNRKEIQEQLEQ